MLDDCECAGLEGEELWAELLEEWWVELPVEEGGANVDLDGKE